MNKTEVYPVGILATILDIKRVLTVDKFKGQRLERIRYDLRIERRYQIRMIKKRNWHDLKNSYNGYLAEHDNHPHNCGSGWTRKRATRRVEALCEDAL